jgi:hypothetical protein
MGGSHEPAARRRPGARRRGEGAEDGNQTMRIHKLLAAAALSALFAIPAHAQSIKKVGAEIHHELKKAGNGIKEGAKDAGSATHNALTKAGNGTKKTLGDATGVHTVGGDVGKIAHKVSHTGKKYGAKAKHGVKHTAAQAHDSLTKAGKDAKATVKNP